MPVLISYTDSKGKKRQKSPDDYDLELIRIIENEEIPYWFPKDVMREGGETHRNDKYGITHVHQFYTRRNLWVLGAIKERCTTPLEHLMLNSQLINLSKMNRHRPGVSFPYNPLSGTLYIASQVCESNVFTAYINKIKRLEEAISLLKHNTRNVLSIASATHMSLPSDSIDYIFTDPPFGANIMYSELNFLQEAWLKVKTDNKEEAIENDTQGKGIMEYTTLMQKCFAEYYRVLKPGRWMTVEFSNTSAGVWNGIQLALNRAGFVIANVSSLDKKQGSFKAVTTPTAVKQDLVISCYKPSVMFLRTFTIQDGTANTWSFVGEQLEHLPIPMVKESKTTAVVERSPKVLYDRLITYFLMRGLPVPIDAQEFQAGLAERFAQRDGMYFLPEQLVKYEEIKKIAPETYPLGLFVTDEANGIEWLKKRLGEMPQTYQEIQPEWMQALGVGGVRKNDILPELMQLLEENFIEEADGRWRLPNVHDNKDVEALRTKALLREFKVYVEAARKPKGGIRTARVEALRAGFRHCYAEKDFGTIVAVGDKIPQNLLTEDEVLLQLYDIAQNKV